MIAAILLAAGNARRFAGPQKLLAVVPHEKGRVPLVRASALAVLDAGLERVVAVVGRDAERVRDALAGLSVACVNNAEYESGMSSSMRVGVTEAGLLWPDADGLLLALGDQPLGGTGIIERLVATFNGQPARRTQRIVAPSFRGTRGNPVIFGRDLVPELLAVSGDHGARSVIERDGSRVAYVEFDREPPLDVDTIDDLANLLPDARNS